MHVLVTGASGFIGQSLVALLRSGGHRVCILARSAAPAETETVICDLGNAPLRLPAGVDAVVHLAQSRAYRAFPADSAEMFRVNVAGTQALLEAAAAAGVRHFCMVSSGTVYEPFEGAALREDAALAPRSYLGASKYAAELLANPFASLFTVSVLRLFSPYGPGQTERLLPDLIRRVRQGVEVNLPENSDGMVFAPTYVDDICAAIETCLSEDWGGTFNLAGPETVSIAEVVALIGQQLGKDVRIARKAMGAPRVVPDLARLAARYDLARFRPLAKGLPPTLHGRQFDMAEIRHGAA